MASLIYLDTHVVAWIFTGQIDRLPPLAQSLIEGNDPQISPIVVLELQYLFEIGRTNRAAEEVVGRLSGEIGLRICDLPFGEVIEGACSESWTGDPFDRIIVSQARLRGAPLLTKDATIRRRYAEALWSRARS